MFDKNSTGSPLTREDIAKKVRSFSIGDKVQVDTEDRKGDIGTITRFYRHFVAFTRDDGTTFTLTNAEVMNAILIKPSKFKIRSDAMDREAVLQALNGAEIKR